MVFRRLLAHNLHLVAKLAVGASNKNVHFVSYILIVVTKVETLVPVFM